MESEEYIILIVILVIFLNTFLLKEFIKIKQKTIIFLTQISDFLINLFNNFILNNLFLIISIILVLAFLILFLSNKISGKIQIKKELQNKINEKINKIQNFLQIDPSIQKIDLLQKEYYEFKRTPFSENLINQYGEEIEIQLEKIKKSLIELNHRKELEEIELRIIEAKKEFEEIKKEIYLKGIYDKEKREDFIWNQKINRKEVFRKEDLSPMAREIIKEEGYYSVNEYCVLERKIIPVFVKPPLNHSPTHAFLNWSIKRLLEQYPKIEEIIEHKTVDADITFKINNKPYAIEIERGSLLGKKVQLNEKINSLNEAYKSNWIFLVSNRNLTKKYRKFGKVCQRKTLKNKIEKWIKDAEKNPKMNIPKKRM